MTRTQRASSPRAIMKDSSLSKSGYDKSLRKGGAGSYNWGSVDDELEIEQKAIEDAELDSAELENIPGDVNAAVRPAVDSPPASASSQTEEEIEKAREFRAKGLNGDVDLASIARTSAAVSTSPKSPSLEVNHDADTNSIP